MTRQRGMVQMGMGYNDVTDVLIQTDCLQNSR